MKNLIYKLRAREGAGAFLAWCNIATAVADADVRDVPRLDRFVVLFPGGAPGPVFTPVPSEVALRWMEITSTGRLAPRRPWMRPDCSLLLLFFLIPFVNLLAHVNLHGFANRSLRVRKPGEHVNL